VQVRISGAGTTTADLLEFIDAEELPAEYCDRGRLKLGHHPYDLRLCSVFAASNGSTQTPNLGSIRRSVSTPNIEKLDSSKADPKDVIENKEKREIKEPALVEIHDNSESSWNPFRKLFMTRPSQQAFLGCDNAFVYDRSRGEWVLQGESIESAPPDDLLEQHAITLAIQVRRHAHRDRFLMG
jgi:hypothetical protein